MLINLHTHLEGRVRPDTAVALAIAAGLDDAIEWDDALELDAPSDLTNYLAKISASYPFFRTHESLIRIAREAVEDAHADGESYLELRFGPASHIHDGFTLDNVAQAVCEGVRQGTEITGMPAAVVIAALRLHSADLNAEVARTAARYAGHGVVGFDLAGDEALFPDLAPFTEAFAIAKAAGLGLTCHAAEAASGQAALRAVSMLGVTRIGHGTHIAEDSNILEKFADLGIAIEVCPTSNLYTGAIPALREHPLPAFRASGIPVVLGDDNPRQTGSPLSAEEAILKVELGLDYDAMQKMTEDSIRVGFMEDHVRQSLQSQLGA